MGTVCVTQQGEAARASLLNRPVPEIPKIIKNRRHVLLGMPACKPALSYETVIITNHLLFLSLYFSLLYFKVLLHKHVSRIEPT